MNFPFAGVLMGWARVSMMLRKIRARLKMLSMFHCFKLIYRYSSNIVQLFAVNWISLFRYGKAATRNWNKAKFAFAHSKNWIFCVKLGSVCDTLLLVPRKDNNNHCNYLQRRKNLLLFIWLWGQICVSLNCDLWRCVECSRTFRRRYKQQNVPRHFCASCHFLSSIVKKICSIVKRLRS